jgi:hypothetical protein
VYRKATIKGKDKGNGVQVSAVPRRIPLVSDYGIFEQWPYRSVKGVVVGDMMNPDVLYAIGQFSDIDTRLSMGVPPGRLSKQPVSQQLKDMLRQRKVLRDSDTDGFHLVDTAIFKHDVLFSTDGVIHYYKRKGRMTTAFIMMANGEYSSYTYDGGYVWSNGQWVRRYYYTKRA